MITAILVVLLILVILFTSIQTLYLESMRLRTRELPSLQYFKSHLEERLKLRPEEGTLTFSLWKHTCLVLFGVTAVAQIVDGGTLTFQVLLESVIGAWLSMMVSAYLIPQVLYRRTSGKWIDHLAPFYSTAALIVRPLVLALGFLQSLLDIATPESQRSDVATPAENIEALITAGTEGGLIQEEDRELIQSVVEFGDKVVREVMTARPNMVAIEANEPLETLHQLVVTEQYSRIPVFEDSIDNILGFVHVRDMFEVPESDRRIRRVRELMRPIQFVPESKPVNDLLREMQQEGVHMVIVVDEYGNTAGLATMEDLVEVILGEIRDEHEPGSDITVDGAGFIVSGNFDVGRVSDVIPEFRRDEDIESTTIGGLVTEWLGHVPKPGETIERDGVRVEILASDEKRVEQVRLSQLQPNEAPESVGAEE